MVLRKTNLQFMLKHDDMSQTFIRFISTFSINIYNYLWKKTDRPHRIDE